MTDGDTRLASSSHPPSRKGTLYGVGLGPGAPDLITLRAARLIAAARVVAYPTLAGAQSFARAIAADLIADDAQEIAMDVPMSVERAPAQAAYDTGAASIALALDAGEDVICLCEGDPFFYGSFMYLFARLSDRYHVEVVPGVTSVTACAARAGMPLVARNERLTILPGPLPEAELRTRIEGAESVVIMKVGRHLPKIRAVIADLGLTAKARYAARATLPDEVILPLADAPDKAPYFSMILLTKGADPWL
ncbi:precorrin-2 C(20)-methyltransferase [Yoonia sediminilitoris]|uniref:Precorrin-2/cobalt-factor-2 C20-methyltransferase n=1 Tax=Yoonia sediminilitoris TaxID=1286148 RepID=A0A2T6KFT0_9RHOB|nr:precorrin-2 C(20)-methyltransferase [Yoonia sediminilitoris]PUB14154.1 precorrin-2/cobalt-factor-2 C20-methyltransferase [Yoonia sediminilitoris]RCW95085.1 precorrin-2/cobalt-factor-2 C20-methyltransferase [Yoonia sediminilitoris]